MTENDYLVLVKNYLSRELAAPYNELLEINNTGLILRLPEGLDFNGAYALLRPMIEVNIKGIKKRKFDVNFTIWSANQLRVLRYINDLI